MTFLRWPSATQALDLADALRARAESDPPPAIGTLSPRRRAAYDRLLDAINRLPRPLMAMGSLALLASALIAPDWFAARMEALSDMPEGLWWIIGAVMSLHFGSRYQAHAQEFQREIVASVATPAPGPEPIHASGPNPALDAWRATRT